VPSVSLAAGPHRADLTGFETSSSRDMEPGRLLSVVGEAAPSIGAASTIGAAGDNDCAIAADGNMRTAATRKKLVLCIKALLEPILRATAEAARRLKCRCNNRASHTTRLSPEPMSLEPRQPWAQSERARSWRPPKVESRLDDGERMRSLGQGTVFQPAANSQEREGWRSPSLR
jgi:hypothetical protein